MKKLSLLALALILCAGMAFANGQQGGAATSASGEPVLKVGATFQDLSNNVWAGRAQALEKLVKDRGGTFVYQSANQNVTTQITQMENLAASGINLLVVHPCEQNAINSECTTLKQQYPDLKIFSWDDNTPNADMCYVLDNTEAGKMIGKAAAKWINDKLGGKAEVAILGYPSTQILLERENGIKAALAADAPGSTVVASAPALTAQQAQSAVETIFQEHPNLKVICAVGGGGSTGANEAVKAAGKLTPDFGVFGSDATGPELSAIKNNEAVRWTMMYSGTGEMIAEQFYPWFMDLIQGKPVEKIQYMTFLQIDASNVDQYM
ncbi:MAG: sugar ABC transporter substrate-binding protein [Spirochaetaceae bacterium]|jgi:ribose transport system substrate-binding protein|nr:sugar ABC transporter substrate-binding protein [Spirochaetaceae bacterium]